MNSLLNHGYMTTCRSSMVGPMTFGISIGTFYLLSSGKSHLLLKIQDLFRGKTLVVF